MNDALRRLSTPSLVVDRDIVRANSDRMRAKAERSGVSLRPHVKTHKTIEGAQLQLGAGTGPITVSTMAEAEFFAEAGFRDITYAVPIAPEKLGRAADLARRIDRLNLLVDHASAVAAIEEYVQGNGNAFDVFLKVDCGYHRAGVDPESPDSIRLAQSLSRSKGVRFRGLLTHAGHSYHAVDVDEIRLIAGQESGSLQVFSAKLAEEGIRELIRSVGSTPTASVVETFSGADEVRPGNYVFFDAFQATVGSCRLEDCAATVVVSVIGVYPEQRKLIVDAGALALSKDLGPVQVDASFGYGIVCDLSMRQLPMKIVSLSQEHGQITVAAGVSLARIAVGSRLRIIPNHSCLTAALFDKYVVVEGAEVVGEWRPVRGW